MMKVWKFSLDTKVMMPLSAKILTVGGQGDDLFVWALVNPDERMVEHTFLIVGTGHAIPDEQFDPVSQVPKFAGTIFLHDRQLVIHVWEVATLVWKE